MLSIARLLKFKETRKFKLLCLTRDPEGTAFIDELRSNKWRRYAEIHHDFGDPTRVFDLYTLFERRKQTHVCYCGPCALMDTATDITGHWPSGTVHFENFGAGVPEGTENKPFKIRLERTGTTLLVPADKSILDVPRSENVRVPRSCESGTCCSCKAGLCSGEADHRDLALRDDEKQTQTTVCVSWASSNELVRDL